MSPGGPQEFMGYNTPVTPIPEPTTLGLLLSGSLLLLGRKR